MSEQDASKLKVRIIMAALDTDSQKIADAIGEHRPVVSEIFNGHRKAIRVRRKLAEHLCHEVTKLIIPEELTAENKSA